MIDGLVLSFLSVDFSNEGTIATTLQIVLLITILSIAPGILILMTCFTRIIIVLSFVRQGLATQTTPPNQVLIGLALFMTFFIMAPVIQDVYETAYVPLTEGELTGEEALDTAIVPIKEFMAQHTREKDLALFMGYGGYDQPETLEDVPITALIPAFAISELKTAFQIGFLIFIPFLVIDMIVASVLMSMGMMMLPPVMIALPFKILLFVLVDGWYLVVQSLLISYQ
ncbi:flagellar type III secretion system pore protein FliP [Shouchella sp. 1P09AA]|uniref:flagellar type III secretion system pore protein FliP n=1 Tax=unclassified Shouchella TaxID=2893065 RepID=UPI0039A0DF7C